MKGRMMEKIQEELQRKLDEYKAVQKDFHKAVSQRNQLEGQLNENTAVKTIVCKRYFKELPFSEIVSFLTQNGVAIRTGVTEIRYIHWKFAGPWLVNTRRLCRLNREKIKPIVAKGLRVGGNEEEVITEGERERVIKKKKKQILLQLKRRKAVRKALRQKQQQKLRKVKSQTGKTKSSVIKRNRYRFSLKVKSHLRSELKAHAKSNSSGVNVNPDSQQVTVVPENTERNSISDYNQENGSTTDNTDKNIPNTDKNIPLSEGISSYDHPEQTVGVKSAKTGQDSVETCMSDKPNDVNAFESAQESVEAQITDDTLKFTSVVTTPNIAEDVESATVSETVGTTPANIIPSSDLDCCGSSNSKQHIPESTVVAEKSKTSEIPNKKAKEVKQENVEVQRPRKRRRDQITRKEKIEMDKTAKVMELKAAARELENSQQIQVSMRPWIRINGTLNRRILDRLLGAILGHCMAKPGNTIESIGERFTPAIQPFHVRELVEILWKLGCVKLFTIRKSWPATLFSPPSNIAILPADGSESSADIMVDPQPDAITRLGQFIGNKTYKKDFISC